jgi:LysR family transcriptional activator of glutamate synthase operon
MELRQLVYFDAVVRHGGFTRAAGHLRVAQPAISAQIRRLETELGVPLLRRTTRRVELTVGGELFWARTRRILEQVDKARAELDELTDTLRGRVVIGATPVLGSFDLPAAIAGFHRRHPGVAVELRSGLLAELLAELDAGRVDLVLGPLHADLAPRFCPGTLVEERLVLIVPPGHRLSEEHPGRLAAAQEEAWVCLPTGSGLHRILLTAAAADGFIPRIAFQTDSPSSVRALVAAGLGVALLAASQAQAPGPPIEIYPLEAPPEHPPIGVIILRASGLPPSVRAMYGSLRPAHRAGTAGQDRTARAGQSVASTSSA